MPLSHFVHERLETARMHEGTYEPNKQATSQFADKNLVMIVGPAVVGKSYVIGEIPTINGTFGSVPVFTTREQRPDDEQGAFRYVPEEDAAVTAVLDQIDRGEVVQYAIHPTTGRMYGTLADDYRYPYNLLATLSGAVENMSRLPFMNTYIIGLVANPDTWISRFNMRYVARDINKIQRAQEATASLRWLLNHTDKITWVDNSEEGSSAAYTIVDVVENGATGDTYGQGYAEQMLEYARKLSL